MENETETQEVERNNDSCEACRADIWDCACAASEGGTLRMTPDPVEVARAQVMRITRAVREGNDALVQRQRAQEHLSAELHEAKQALEQAQRDANKPKTLDAVVKKLQEVTPEALEAARELDSDFQSGYADALENVFLFLTEGIPLASHY